MLEGLSNRSCLMTSVKLPQRDKKDACDTHCCFHFIPLAVGLQQQYVLEMAIVIDLDGACVIEADVAIARGCAVSPIECTST